MNFEGVDIGDEVWHEDECLRHDPHAERIEGELETWPEDLRVRQMPLTAQR